MEAIITIDIGTSAVKVALWEAVGDLIDTRVAEYALDAVDGRIEVEPQVYLDAIAAAVRDLVAAHPAWPIRAICCTTQGETLILLDEEGRPCAPAIVWLDDRAELEARQLQRELGRERVHAVTGLPGFDGTLPLAKLMHLRTHEAERWSRTRSVVLVEDFIVHSLTGRLTAGRSVHCSTGWFDIAADELWEDALAAAGLDASLFGERVSPGETIGAVTADAADRLGLTPGIPVIAGAMDQVCVALAAGVVEPGIGSHTAGTALVVASAIADPSRAIGTDVTVYRHAVPGMSLALGFRPTAGIAVTWLREILALGAGDAGYAAFDALAAQSEPGCGGVRFRPVLSGPGGGWDGITLSTTRAQLARSVYEALAGEVTGLLAGLDAVGAPIRTLRVSGGGAQSEVWLGITADLTDRPLERLAVPHAASTGAAIIAAWGLGLLPRGSAPRPAISAELAPATTIEDRR
ncbi:L-fuculokinase [Microbacterium sp. NPDC058342]|uniref:FGGY-family carbohydrate kinase n=1 Tax=Microbacterium sp. NPDC058342 TaxID=3346454 RepID=UPI003667B431